MSGKETPDSRLGPIGPMYVVDFLDHIRVRNESSCLEALSIIRVIGRYGTAVAKAEMLDENCCVVRTHIGYGLEAVIEMERDRSGKWQPVIGEIVKR